MRDQKRSGNVQLQILIAMMFLVLLLAVLLRIFVVCGVIRITDENELVIVNSETSGQHNDRQYR